MAGQQIVLRQGETLSEEQVKTLQEQQIININTKYIKILKHSLKTIKELDPKDRLELARAIWVIVECMKGSIQGWDAWLNLQSMTFISEEDLKKILPIMKEVALKWIQVDIDTKTDEISVKTEERKKKTKKAKKPKKSSKDIYVA